jgi:alkaline phosphatase
LLGIAFVFCAGTPQSAPRNVILFIADGAGVGHWTLAKFASSDLAVEQFPVVGLVDTRGEGHVVSGSAAGATAFSIGSRTFFGGLGLGPDSTPRETVLEVARASGMATGMITTTWLVDATPAAFAAHVPRRDQLTEIMRQIIDQPVDVLLGGGQRIFEIAGLADSVDLWSAVAERYHYIDTAEQLEGLDPDSARPLLGLFAPGEMDPAPDRSPSLPSMTTAALAILDRDPDGFFLMIENEGSDTYAHRNATQDVLLAEMIDFDNTIRVALDYQAEHPATLIVVASDHETGGVLLMPTEERNMTLQYGTGSHTAALVPIFAIGPGAEQFGGIKENWEVGQLLLQAVGRR